MNIFVLDQDPVKCAAYHCDKHVIKMILEHTQMLSSAIQYHGGSADSLYKVTHINHPCSIWVRESNSNFIWLCDLTIQLFKEYASRYGKSHKTMNVFEKCLEMWHVIPAGKLTEHPKCMPDGLKTDSVVESYRNYYMIEKRHFVSWKTSAPDWYK